MNQGILFYFTKPSPNRPIDEQYVAEIKGERTSFVHQNDAMLYLFDNGVRKFRRLTKEVKGYKNIKNIPFFEFWHIQNRVGYLVHGYQRYIDENDKVKQKRAYVWSFVGFGRVCFAETKEELKSKVLERIEEYRKIPPVKGYNTYPYFTRYYREEIKQISGRRYE